MIYLFATQDNCFRRTAAIFNECHPEKKLTIVHTWFLSFIYKKFNNDYLIRWTVHHIFFLQLSNCLDIKCFTSYMHYQKLSTRFIYLFCLFCQLVSASTLRSFLKIVVKRNWSQRTNFLHPVYINSNSFTDFFSMFHHFKFSKQTLQ